MQTERERLVRLIMKANSPLISPTRAEELADFLLDNSVIVPPCKVGDTVYEFFDVRGFYHTEEWEVENIVIGKNPSKCILYCKSKRGNSKEKYHNDCFGKTLFFTREEAEQALKEGATE